MAHNNQKHHIENSLEKNILLPQNEGDIVGVDEDFVTKLSHSSTDFQQLRGCNKTDRIAEHKWFNVGEDLTGNKILSDNEIVHHVINEEEAKFEMKEHPHEQDLVPTEKVSHSSALCCVQCPMDYLEQQKGQFSQSE
jgi:hypothetical protein